MASFILRKIDDVFWSKFKARASAEGHSLKWIILRLIQRYIDRGLD
jgi:hypothetical protein